MSLERIVPAPGTGPSTRRGDLNAWAIAGVLALMWATLAILPATRAEFLTQGTITTLLLQGAVLLILSVGMTLVIVIRGIDLSVGAGVALTGVIAALLHQKLGLPVPVVFVLTLGCGAALGAWHGAWVAWLGVPAFIVTLAGFKAYRGGALVMSHAQGLTLNSAFDAFNRPISPALTWLVVVGVLAIGAAVTVRDAARRRAFGLAPTPTGIVIGRIIGQTLVAALLLAVFGGRGIPVLVLIAAAVAIAGIFVTRRMRFGRQLYAIGGNPEAARLSGIDVKRVTIYAYMILGTLTALAGFLLAARVDGVSPGVQGQLLELDAVTAVVIGGTSLSGGRGSVVGTVLGTLVFATLAKGMSILRIDSNWQLIFTGAILLVAVLLDVLSKGRRS